MRHVTSAQDRLAGAYSCCSVGCERRNANFRSLPALVYVALSYNATVIRNFKDLGLNGIECFCLCGVSWVLAVGTFDRLRAQAEPH